MDTSKRYYSGGQTPRLMWPLGSGRVTSCEARGLSSVGDVGGTRLSPQGAFRATGGQPLSASGSGGCLRCGGCCRGSSGWLREGGREGWEGPDRATRSTRVGQRRRYLRQPGAVESVRPGPRAQVLHPFRRVGFQAKVGPETTRRGGGGSTAEIASGQADRGLGPAGRGIARRPVAI